MEVSGFVPGRGDFARPAQDRPGVAVECDPPGADLNKDRTAGAEPGKGGEPWTG